jgi:hypothetical protein
MDRNLLTDELSNFICANSVYNFLRKTNIFSIFWPGLFSTTSDLVTNFPVRETMNVIK